jgi:hypothetical protein
MTDQFWYYDDQVFDDLEEAVEIATNNYEEQTPADFPLRIHRAKPYYARSLTAQSLAKALADALVPRSPDSLWQRRDTPKDLLEYLVENFVDEFPAGEDFDDWEPKPDRQRLLWAIRLFCLVNLPLFRLMRWLGWMRPMKWNSWFSPRRHSLGLGLLQREIGRWERLQNGDGLLWQEDENNWDEVSWEDFRAMFPELFEELANA